MRKEKMYELQSIIEELETKKLEESKNGAKFIKGIPYECKLANGKTITREKLTKGGKDGSAVIVLPYTTEGDVILTVEPRVFTKRTVGIGIPAGYIEEGETPLEAAKRELREETGYISDKFIPLGGFYQDMGCSAAYNRCFLALDAIKKYKQNLDQDEFVKYFKCCFNEALELIDLGYIEGCNAIITFNRAEKELTRLREKRY